MRVESLQATTPDITGEISALTSALSDQHHARLGLASTIARARTCTRTVAEAHHPAATAAAPSNRAVPAATAAVANGGISGAGGAGVGVGVGVATSPLATASEATAGETTAGEATSAGAAPEATADAATVPPRGSSRVERTATIEQRDFEADLITEHIGLAHHIAHQYARRGEAIDDLEQVAKLALVRAARRFDPNRGIPFAAFAGPSIAGELKRHFRDRAWSMRVPRPLKETYLRVRRARDELEQTMGRVPTVQEIAEHLGINEERIVEAMEAGSTYRPASLDGWDDSEQRHRTPSVVAGYDQVLDLEVLKHSVHTLTQEERQLLHWRFVEERTQASIAAEIGCSQMHVSRWLARLLARLRADMTAS